jgi:hypothetical protein
LISSRAVVALAKGRAGRLVCGSPSDLPRRGEFGDFPLLCRGIGLLDVGEEIGTDADGTSAHDLNTHEDSLKPF